MAADQTDPSAGGNSRARPIDLAVEPPFTLGPLTVDPGTRRIVHADGREAFIEPRIMQVLIALVQARGAILSRDALVDQCWSGRIVGEDAITRVISRVRRLAGGIGQGVFTVETLPKVGYRLLLEQEVTSEPVRPADRAPPPGRRLSRRLFIGAGAAAGILAAGAGGYALQRWLQGANVTPEVETLMAQAWQAWAQGTDEGISQAIGLSRRATEIAPEYADAWGFLGSAYASRANGFARAAEREHLRERAREAGRRALELDPINAYGRVALAWARPTRGNWLLMEREFLGAIEDQPDRWLVNYALGVSYSRVGRLGEAAERMELVRAVAPTSTQYFIQAEALWGAGRIDEADRLIDEAMRIYATSPGMWHLRMRFLVFGGRPAAAVAMAQDMSQRPPALTQAEAEQALAVARAVERRDPAEVEPLLATLTGNARAAAGAAPFAIQVAATLGRLDEAFALAGAYYFSRGQTIPDEKDGRAASLEERNTRFLFMPSVRTMRADRRFGPLVEELGLERYWREAGVQPDFRTMPAA